ncbi:MAG: type transporter [Verrucomicrobiales bacterium]|nr:type transporter [Verrucomicrobiales bacterium]
MTVLRLLLALSLRRALNLLIAMGLLLAGFQVLLVFIAGSIERSGEFEQLASLLPPFVRAILGPSLASVMSFKGVVCIGYFEFIIVVALLALTIALATLPASEVETGFADLILARPLPRHWIITRTIALLLLVLGLMLALMLAGTWVGLATVAPKNVEWPTLGILGALALNLGLLMLCWGGVALALAAACRRTVASAVTGLLAFASLLLDLTGHLWPPAERLSQLSPFHYFVPFDLVMGRSLPVENVILLWAVAMTGFILAYYFFSQRDISH